MLTAVVSDLHLGARMSALATPPVRERLLAELDGADQVVLLGDVLALRDQPVAGVLRAAGPFFAGLREVAAGKRVVIVPGNHDHRIARSILGAAAGAGLGLEQVAQPGADPLERALARSLDGVDLAIAYPGLWIRPDVYATHGHYLDCHMSVPRLECLLAAASGAAVGRPPERGAAPRDYEAVLAPIYDFAYEYAQGTGGGRRAARAEASLWRRVQDFGWRRVSGGGPAGRLLPRAAAGAVAVGALGAINLAGLGPFNLDLSPPALGRAGVRAAGELVSRLGIDAGHVIFGHTHRAGPLAGEGGWESGLVNCGSWVHSDELIGEQGPHDPFWPGHCVHVRDSGPPELRLVLEEPAPALAAA